jgi:hypothetical protein
LRFYGQKSVDFLQLETLAEGKYFSKKEKSDHNYGVLPLGMHYRISLQPAIWRTSFLKKCLSYETIFSTWDFEAFLNDNDNAKGACANAKCFIVRKNHFPVLNGIEKGMISYPALRLLKNSKIKIPVTRSIDNRCQYFKRHAFDNLRFNCPRHLRIFLKKIGKLFGKKYYTKY